MKKSDAAPRGRPRRYDRDDALDRAMRLFWERGFDATSISDLATATGMNPPSLYAAFGDKRRMFRSAVERYAERHGGFVAAALAEEPTAERAVRRLLVEAAQGYARDGFPRGCLIATVGPAAEDVAAELAARRRAQLEAIRARMEAGAAADEFARDVDTAVLALWVAAQLYGLSAAARDGAGSDALLATVDRTMAGWPRARS